MNDPEDRPTPSDRPAPQNGAPEERVPPAPGGPPGNGGDPVEPVDPVAPSPPRVEPVEPVAPVAPAPAPAAAEQSRADEWPEPGRVVAPASAAAAGGRVETVDDDEYDEEPASRWVSMMATIGTALIAIVSVQVVASLVEGMTLSSGQRVGVPDDLFHRLGYPFGGLGATALVFLVLGVVLVAVPSLLDELLSESQERVVGVSLVVAIAMAVLIAVGSLLAVRANLHEYSAKNVAVPTFVRVQFTNFLLGALGAAALALYGAIASINERSRERFD